MLGVAVAAVSGVDSANAAGADRNASAHAYDGRAAARYALRWSREGGVAGAPVARYNPAYPVLADNGANFVSQALEAGGWNRRGGAGPDAPPAWTPDLAGRRGPSAAWSRPDRLFRFATHHTGRAVAGAPATPDDDWATVWTLDAGDLVFVDRQSDGVVDGALVVVGRVTSLGFTEPTVSQHSPHRHDVPISAWIKTAALRDPAMTLHPVVPRRSYVEP